MHINFNYKRNPREVVRPTQYNLLVKTSGALIVSTLWSCYNGYYDCSVLGMRNMDITVLYHLWRTVKSNAGLSFYHLSLYFYKKRYYWLSTYFTSDLILLQILGKKN